jgi:thiol-disulfide isomerase/thioredoxin
MIAGRLAIVLSCSLILQVFFNNFSSAQQRVFGRIFDAETLVPVPYASVSVDNTSVGVVANEDGYFAIVVADTTSHRTISISSLGYEPVTIQSKADSVSVVMKPIALALQEVVVEARDLNAKSIVKKAFKNIRKNYNAKPFVYRSFYRHYCKDGEQYGRLIEAAFELHKPKGYKTLHTRPGLKDEVRVLQLRRSYDQTKLSSMHQPIGLNLINATDFVSYQVKSKQDLMALSYDVSTLKANLNRIEFHLNEVSSFENRNVYVIDYEFETDSVKSHTGFFFESTQKGRLYINVNDYAFIRVEFLREGQYDTLRWSSSYRKYGKYYYLYHNKKEGVNTAQKMEFRHRYHIETITTEVLEENFEKFSGKEPDERMLQRISFSPSFWGTYNILQETPLERKIINDLSGDTSLQEQFLGFNRDDSSRTNLTDQNERAFFDWLHTNRGKKVILIDFWASWCQPCLREFQFYDGIQKKFQNEVAYALISLDKSQFAWMKAINQNKLQNLYNNHFLVGPSNDLLKLFEVRAIPRYILIGKDGQIKNYDAPYPPHPGFHDAIQQLLNEN